MLAKTPAEIGEIILDVSNWPKFEGWGPMPGIRSAVFIERTPEIVGSVVAVTNTDGSTHTERVVRWELPSVIELELTDFSKPLAWFAERFEEHWRMSVVQGGTSVERTFRLVARSWVGVCVLKLVRPMLRRAVMRSMRTYE